MNRISGIGYGAFSVIENSSWSTCVHVEIEKPTTDLQAI
jgi:hypothetical protein